MRIERITTESTSPKEEVSLEVIFNQFLQEKRYLQNVSNNTLQFYKAGFKAFKLTEPVTQQQLNLHIVRLRENGMSLSCLNAYIRSISSFLSWLGWALCRFKLLWRARGGCYSFTFIITYLVNYQCKVSVSCMVLFLTQMWHPLLRRFFLDTCWPKAITSFCRLCICS